MDAVCYHGPRNLEIIKTAIPEVGINEVLLKVTACGVCGTDHHLAEGEFIAKFPLIPGHEIVGVIEKLGSKVQGFEVGERCVVDPGVLCETCFYCRRGKFLQCENFNGLGVTIAGGFANFVAVQAKQLYRIHNLTDEEATLIEPAACAVHGIDKLAVPMGADALVLGAGPTGLILAQLLKLTGAARVVIAAHKGPKTEIAKKLNAADEYVEIDRHNPEAGWAALKAMGTGFDVVIEATGSEKVANDAIDYVRRGGTLMLYAVYSDAARVTFSPSRIFGEEIKIIGSFAQTHCFPRAVEYLDSGKVKVKGMVTHAFSVQDYQKALDKMNSKEACKVIVKP